jgi:two-component system response regulator HydG
MGNVDSTGIAGKIPKVLIVDDEASARGALIDFFEEEGFEARGVGDAYKALGKFSGWRPDIVLTDLAMPGMSGLELLAKLRTIARDVPVVMMTAYGSVDSAIRAHREGATDFIVKPLQLEHVLYVVRRALEESSLRSQANQARLELPNAKLAQSIGMVGESSVMAALLRQAVLAGSSSAHILIQGEPGTGRSLLARAIHELGARRDRPFVEVSCAGQGPARAARTLFGAVAGIEGGRKGAVDRARGGTLVIDGVEDIPDSIQSRLVLMLDQGFFERGDEKIDIDVRLMGITSASDAAETTPAGLHPDLYYAMGVMELKVPTLREREGDIESLAQHFAKREGSGAGKSTQMLAPRAIATLSRYSWPGNVRQLQSVIAAAVAISEGVEVEPRDLPAEIRSPTLGGSQVPVIPGAKLDDVERWAIIKTLDYTGGNTARTAKILGVSPRKVQYRVAEYREEGVLD